MEPTGTKPQVFYRWIDGEGRLHVVSSLEAVPSAERAKVERVALSADTALGATPRALTEPWRLEPGSFGLGFGVALLLSLLFRFLPNSWRSMTKIALGLGVCALLAGLYLGAIRRATGQGDGNALATPSALIRDARSAVEKLNQRQHEQEEELRKLQAEGR